MLILHPEDPIPRWANAAPDIAVATPVMYESSIRTLLKVASPFLSTTKAVEAQAAPANAVGLVYCCSTTAPASESYACDGNDPAPSIEVSVNRSELLLYISKPVLQNFDIETP